MLDLVHTLFVMRAGKGETRSVLPAYSAQLLSFVAGRVEMQFPEREARRSSDITLKAPMLRAAPMILDGPVLSVGASFTPLGWATFSGLAADKTHDTAFPADTLIADEALSAVKAALPECRSGAISPEAYSRVIEDMIRTVCASPQRQPRADHRELVRAIDAWLASAFNPSIKTLYDSVELGQRQVQRLCRRYFGVPPAQLIKRYRAIRAAMLLAHDDLSDDLRDEVLEAYFDQAHLINDVRRYTGRTPRSLTREPLAQDMLDPDGHGRSGKRLRDS